MKVVLAFSLAFLAVVYGTASFQGLFSTTNQLTLTSTAKNSADGWAIVGLTVDSTYKGDNSGSDLHVKFNATYTGTLAQNLAPLAVITYSGQTPYTGAGGATCSQATADSASPVLIDGTNHAIMYQGDLSPYFTGTATVTLTVQLQFPPTQNQGASQSATFTVTSPYVPATGITPTAVSFALASTFGATDDVAANITISNTVATPYTVQLVFTGASPQGVAYITSCYIMDTVAAAPPAIGGTCGSDANRWSDLAAYTGSWCGDAFQAESHLVGLTYPKNTQLTLRSVTIAKSGGGSNSLSGGSSPFGGNSFMITTGGTDNTAPTCTSALFTAPLAITTANTDITNTVTVLCTDETGGSGILTGGVFVRAVAGSLTYDFAADGGVFPAPSVDVPLHYDGTVSILGVWAMDNSGNTAVYGSCAAGYAPDTICGGSGGSSGSSAVIASISLVIVLILAVLAL